jgi:hypothetical protein
VYNNEKPVSFGRVGVGGSGEKLIAVGKCEQCVKSI